MAVPMGWHVTGYLMAGILIAVLIFLSIASYSRVVTATGIIQPDKGVAVVMPSRSGVIMKMMVADGDQVEEGQELVAVRSEDYLVSVNRPPKNRRDARPAECEHQRATGGGQKR